MKKSALFLFPFIIALVSSSCKKTTTTTTTNSSQPTQPNIIIAMVWGGGGSQTVPGATVTLSPCWYSVNGGIQITSSTSHAYATFPYYNGEATFEVSYAHIGDVYTIGYPTPTYFRIVETNPTFTVESTNGVISQTVTSNGQDNENNNAAIIAGTNTMTAFSFTVH